jgi:hypothetical protein
MTKYLYLLLFLLVAFQSFSEGTSEVMPSPSNGTALWVYPDATTGSYPNCSSESRLFFYIDDHVNENLYLGLHILTRTSTPTNGYYRIRNSAGTVVAGPTSIPTSAPSNGFISNYGEAISGPNIGGANPSGYTPNIFNPTANGAFYIEFYLSSDGGASSLSSELYFPFFDFTVATTAGTVFPGRVYSQQWSLITFNPSNLKVGIDYSMEGAYYGYTQDSSVVKLDFETGFRPYGFNLAMNFEGVSNTGDFLVDRKSIHHGKTFPSIVKRL